MKKGAFVLTWDRALKKDLPGEEYDSDYEITEEALGQEGHRTT